MRNLFVFLVGCGISLLFNENLVYSQSYLNIRLADGSDKNLPFTALKKISFDVPGDHINFVLTDATMQTVGFNAIGKLTTSDAGAGTVLPVELVMFSARMNCNNVELTWQTASEVNNYGFELERDTPDGKWVRVSFIQGHGTSNSPVVYRYVDTPQKRDFIQYRLKQIDVNGSYRYSEAASVRFGIPTAYELVQNYPNPFNPSTEITYEIPADCRVVIKVFDAIGREAASLVNENKKAGRYMVSFDASRLSGGVYFCTMQSATFTRTIKMMLLK